MMPRHAALLALLALLSLWVAPASAQDAPGEVQASGEAPAQAQASGEVPAQASGEAQAQGDVSGEAQAQGDVPGEAQAQGEGPQVPGEAQADVTRPPGVQEVGEGARPTIQARFAPKASMLTVQPMAMLHMRDDFYRSWGYGADVGFFLSERWGVEARVVSLRTRLSDAAVDLKERVGLVPDARPQDLWALAGVRFAPGYGKLLMFDGWVQHVEPQWVARAGVANVDSGMIPTLNTAFSLMFHFPWGIKATLDLGASMQWEARQRGRVFSLGFAPSLGIGWGGQL